MFNRILCPVDGSEHARKALVVAIDLARRYEAELLIVHVLTRHRVSAELKEFARVEGLAPTVQPELDRLQALEARLDYRGDPDDPDISSRVLVEIGQYILGEAKRDAESAGQRDVDVLQMSGDPADQVLRCVQERGVDCVVMGSRGLSDFKGLVLGSVSHKVANRAPCTCIAVK